MNKIFLFTLVALFSSNAVYANLLSVSLPNSTPQIQKFISDVEAKLPPAMIAALSKEKKINVVFSTLKNDSNKIQIPNCENTVDSFVEADAVTAEYSQVLKTIKSKNARYNKQIYSYVDKNTVVMNAGFADVISKGESAATRYNCEHRNLYRLAQASLINGLAAIYDNKISSSLKYMTIAGWSKKQKNVYGFWPRAVNPYEYAGGPSEHFATNVEFFLLDPEYACRRPLLQDFFTRHFAQNNAAFDPLKAQRQCKVNFVLKIPKEVGNISADGDKDFTPEELLNKIESFDLSPDKIFNINYLRAGASSGAGSFGHAMFRFLACGPNQANSSECTKENYSLVINPRANPLEMRLDTMKGIFGGYPSQFLITPLLDIRNEYARRELRHLYNVPMTGGTVHDSATGQDMEVMPQDQKIRFIYATLDQYWAYYGRYKFLSNNCADEAMRLYQMSSENPEVLKLDVLLPQDFNKKLSKLGLADEAKTKGLEPAHGIFRKLVGSLLKKDVKWDKFEALYKQAFAAGDNSTMISFNYDVMKSIREIMILEGKSEKEYNSSKAISKESKQWIEIASPSIEMDEVELQYYLKNKKVSEKKLVEITNHLNSIKVRYNNLLAKSKTPEQKHIVMVSFYKLIYLVLEKRRNEVGNEAVQMAYATVYPKNEKDDIRAKLTPEALSKIKKALDDFSHVQQSMMPYREFSTKPGYGIPLESDVTRGFDYAVLIGLEMNNTYDIIDSLGPLIGTDKEVVDQLTAFQKQIVGDKTN